MIFVNYLQPLIRKAKHHFRWFLGFLLNRLLIDRGVNLGLRRCFFLRSNTAIKATRARNSIVSVIYFRMREQLTSFGSILCNLRSDVGLHVQQQLYEASCSFRTMVRSLDLERLHD